MDRETWNQIIADFQTPQHLQTWEWGAIKSQYSWQPHYKVWKDKNGDVEAAALVLERTITLPGMAARLRMHYTPKGPLLRDWEDKELRTRVISDLKEFAKQRRAFFIKIDPDLPVGQGAPQDLSEEKSEIGQIFVEEIKRKGWRYSNEQVQFKNTVIIDLSPSEEELLSNMKQKTRYNVRLAERKGVTVRVGSVDDFEMLFKMYAETAVRDGFTIRNKEYYLVTWKTFFESEMLSPLIAEVEGEPVAAIMLIHFSTRAWYMYGMSRPIHRNLMPTYLLQWEAIKIAKSKGCMEYDLWGAPEKFDESDSLWGVYRFKAGLGGQVHLHIGAWDLPVRPWLYNAYTKVLPKMISIMRQQGDLQTKQEI